MMENNWDTQVREKLRNREIQPSASAWERLSNQLDEQDQKSKKNWFLYIGYAASIALIISLFFLVNRKSNEDSIIPEKVIVDQEVKIPELDTSKEFVPVEIEDEAIVETEEEKQVIKVEKPVKEIKQSKPLDQPVIIANTEKETIDLKLDPKEIKEVIKTENTVVAEVDANQLTIDTNKTISVDSDALLYSVTHSKEEIRGYYEKYKVSRAKVLKTINQELKKSRLNIDPNTILAEVEMDVNEENFQNNFYQFIRKRVSDVATAIANRND